MTKEEFSQLLREWRRANGLTRKELAARLGVSEHTVTNYEIGRSRPSPSVSRRLADELKCDLALIPQGTHDAYCSKQVLSDDERQFAEQNHNVVLLFLKVKRLRYDEWYDVVIFGYLRAVENWFKKPSLREVCSFKKVAFLTMRSAVYNERRKQCLKTVSIYEPIPNTENLVYGDTLCDPRENLKTGFAVDCKTDRRTK